jgi:hypothetical protein
MDWDSRSGYFPLLGGAPRLIIRGEVGEKFWGSSGWGEKLELGSNQPLSSVTSLT